MSWVKKIFYLDLRSLGLLRIGLGLIIVIDSIQKLFNVRAFFSDDGVYPRIALIDSDVNSWAWSLNMINGSTEFQALLLVALTTAAGLYMIGYKTKISGWITWILTASFMVKNPMIIQGGDDELCLILFWSLLLPIERKFSLDSENLPPEAEQMHFSVASIGYLVQISCVYFFAGILKTSPEWRETGTALNIALSNDQFARPFGRWLLHFPGLLRILTKISLYWELLGAALLFTPVFGEYARLVFVLSAISFHFGIELTMSIGNFPWICMVSTLGLLPSLFWSRIENAEPRGFSSHGRKWPAQAFVGALLVYVLVWNVNNLYPRPWPKTFMGVAYLTRLEQKWDMFAPSPTRENGWYVMPGELEDGTAVDVFNLTAGAPSFAKPENVSDTFHDFRWKKYLFNYYASRFSSKRIFFGKYLCREWASAFTNASRLKSFKIYFMLEKTNPEAPSDPPQKIDMWTHNCY